MTPRPIVAAVTIVATLAVGGAFAQPLRGAEAKRERPVGRIAEAVLEAKAARVSEIEIPPPPYLPTGVDSLDAIAQNYSVFVARPIAIVVSPAADSSTIVTWYKLKVQSTVIRQAAVSRDGLPPGVPPELLPVARDEVLLPYTGGRIVVEGIIIKQQPHHGFHLDLTKDYVLSLFLESSGAVANLAAGPDGVFAVDSDGMLTPMGRSDHPLVQEVHVRQWDKLEFLRSSLRERKQAK